GGCRAGRRRCAKCRHRGCRWCARGRCRGSWAKSWGFLRSSWDAMAAWEAMTAAGPARGDHTLVSVDTYGWGRDRNAPWVWWGGSAWGAILGRWRWSSEAGMKWELGSAADALPAMVWIAHLDGSLAQVNRAWCEFSGQAPTPDWAGILHPDDLARFTQ